MPRPPVKRRYDASGRQAVARLTRAQILSAARRSFVQHGYAATTMAEVARLSGVALDTIYTSIGPKQLLFRLLLESALSGTDEVVPAHKREYVQAIRAEPRAREKLAIYAHALCAIHERLAPLVNVLREAAPAEPQLAVLWKDIAERRARNMRVLARELAATGSLRPELALSEVADVLWATNAPELYLLLVQERNWRPARFATWLASSWARLLLVDSAP